MAKWLIHRSRRRLQAITHNDDGFTLIEAVVSFVLFAIISAASVTAMVNGMKSDNSTNNRVLAANLAQQDLQQARAIADRTTLTSLPAVKRTVGTKTFTVTRTVSDVCTPGNDSSGDAAASVEVTATVSWPGSTSDVTVATELAC